MQKSYRAPNPGDKRPWFIIDAKDQPIGRLAVVIANKLRAKDLPTFDPSVDAGAFVIVTNAALVKLKEFTAAEMRAKHPDRMIKEAVWGMLPKNNIARKMMTRVKVFAGEADKGTLAAQKPVEIKL